MAATGYTGGDPTKFNKSGGTLTGTLTVGDDGGEGLTVKSSFAGGEDDGQTGHFDSTGRLNLESYQRASFNSYGEVIRIYSRRWDSKQMIAWYGPHSYDTNGDPVGSDYPWFWMGAHYEANDHGSVHGHWSCEIPDTSGALQTRFEIPIWNPVTGVYGMDKGVIKTNAADFNVRCSNGQELRLSAPAGTEKPITFSNDSDGQTAYRRWKIRATNDAESGANAGTNFQIARYDDTGTLVDTPVQVTRSTGLVTIGGTSGTGGGLLVNRNTSSALQVTNTGTGGAGMLVTLADSTSSVTRGQVSGDTTPRYAVLATGQIEWGSGSATRDVNLYRAAADRLKTDDSLQVALRLGVGQAPDASASMAVTTASDTQSLYMVNTTAGGNTGQAHLRAESATSASLVLGSRVTGDQASRFVVLIDGQHQWGDGTNSRDTNLYRSAADVLKTDDSFHVGVNLRLNTTSMGGGVGVVGMANAGTVPASNPTGGGVLYAEGGALKWRGSSGTITTIAAA